MVVVFVLFVLFCAVSSGRRHSSFAWLGKSPTCWRHVGPTAKSRHFWPTWPSRADTNLFPTLFLCRGLPTFFKFSLSTRGTYGVIKLVCINIKQSVQPGYFFAPLTYYYSLNAHIFFSASIIEKQHLTTSHLTTSAAAA
jgi:hypothetical protein